MNRCVRLWPINTIKLSFEYVIGNHEQSKAHWQKPGIRLLAALAWHWSSDIAWQKVVFSTKGTLFVRNYDHKWHLSERRISLSINSSNKISVRHAYNQLHFFCFISCIKSSIDLNTNVPLQNFGGFHWCVPRTKCCFSHEIGTRSQSGRRFQFIQIRHFMYIGYYLWWVCVNLEKKNHFIMKHLCCGLLKWLIFQFYF